MAKSKTHSQQQPDHVTDAHIASVLAEIEKEFGAGIVRSGRDLVNDPPQVIPFSPSMDLVLGGGIAEGSWVMVAGPPKGGKTVSALSFAANCQRPEYGARPVMVISAEHRLDPLTLNGIRGLKLDPPHFYFVESTRGKVMGSDDFLNVALKFIKSVERSVVVLDSVSALVNPKVITDGLGTSDFGSGNRIVSQFCDIAAPIVKANKNIILCICQQYANTSGYGKKTVDKVASKVKYQSDVILHLNKFAYETGNGEDEPPTGQVLDWVCDKASLTGPGGKCQSYIRFGVGIDRTRELMVRATDYGLVERAGSWLTMSFLEGKPEHGAGENGAAPKFQGVEKAFQFLEENPAALTELDRQVRSVVAPEQALAA